jgi:1,4-alpha-glucan branching enzyme
MFRWLKDLNDLYRRTPALHRVDFDPAGFEWIDCEDRESSVISFLRKTNDGAWVAVACNLTPVPRLDYRIGVPSSGLYVELLSSDSAIYGGTGSDKPAGDEARPEPHHGRPASISLTLPPLSIVFFRCV